MPSKKKPRPELYKEVRPIVPPSYRVPADAPAMDAESLRKYVGWMRERKIGQVVTIERVTTSWDDIGAYVVRVYHSMVAVIDPRLVTFTNLQHNAAQQWIVKIAEDNGIDPAEVRPGKNFKVNLAALVPHPRPSA